MESAVSNLVTPRAASSERRARLVFVGLGLLLGLAAPLLLNARLPPTRLKNDMAPLPATVDVGFLDPLELAHGFYEPETAPDGTTFRWTGPHATLTFPYAANLGRDVVVGVRLAANRAAGQAPADVSISVNGRPPDHFTLAGDFQYHVIAFDAYKTPDPYLDPSHVQVDIQSSTVTNNNDPRQLGVAVDWIQMQAERAPGDLVSEGVVWAAALVIVLLVATTRFSLPWSLLYGFAALLSFALVHATPVPRAIPVTVEVALAGLAWLLAAWLAPRQRPAWGLGLAACGLWLLVAGRLLGDWQIDDAYISYRYAWNLAHGSGLVYNPGQAPVEGYTTFLWTLLAAAAIALGLHPAGVTLAANIALAQGIVGLTYYLSARLSGRAYPWPLLAALFLSVDVALLSYGARGSGMEAVAFAFFVLLSVAFLWREQDAHADPAQGAEKDDGPWTMGASRELSPPPSSIVHRPLAGLCLALASLTRPEGLLVAAILLGIKAWQDQSASGARQAVRLALAALVPFLAIVGPYQAWRIAFYGYPFPNTFYAKTDATVALAQRGLEHLSLFWSDHWLPATLAALGLAFILLEPQRRRAHLALAALVVEYTLYVVWVGGDYFPGWRFFVPIVAPLVLLAQEGARLALGYLPSKKAAKGGAGASPAGGLGASPNYSFLSNKGGAGASRRRVPIDNGQRGHPPIIRSPNKGGAGVSPAGGLGVSPNIPFPSNKGGAGAKSLPRVPIINGRWGWPPIIPFPQYFVAFSKAFDIRLGAAALLGVLAALYLGDALWIEQPTQPLAEQTKLQATYINRWGSAGLWLRDNTPPQTWIVAKGAGAIAYYSQRRVIDIFGLNDLHIAHLAVANMGEGKAGHEKQDPQYVLDRRPNYILAEWDPNFQPIKAQLKRDYEYLSARAPTGPTFDWWRLK